MLQPKASMAWVCNHTNITHRLQRYCSFKQSKLVMQLRTLSPSVYIKSMYGPIRPTALARSTLTPITNLNRVTGNPMNIVMSHAKCLELPFHLFPDEFFVEGPGHCSPMAWLLLPF